MATINRFEDIIAWQKARVFAKDCYVSFASIRDYSFKDQVQRAEVSVMNNIAEGFERKGNKEFQKFLFIAKGSCAEVKSTLYLASDLKYINDKQCSQLNEQSQELSRIIQGLIKTLQ